jgi:hypothetical protein
VSRGVVWLQQHDGEAMAIGGAAAVSKVAVV